MKKYSIRYALAAALILLFTACGGGGGGDGGGNPGSQTDTDGDGVADTNDTDANNPCLPDVSNTACESEKVEVDDYFAQELPTWDEFAYSPEYGGTPKVDREGLEQDVEGESPVIEDILDSDGLTKVCTTQRVSFADTPEEYVMFSTPSILYPGALIRGRSLRDGTGVGDLLPLNVDQRNTVTVSIPACSFADNFEETLPTLAGVNSAIGAIISRAEQEGDDCITASSNLDVETFSSENERALKASIAGRYLNYSGGASGSIDQSRTKTTVAAIFRESLYTVAIQAPQRPSSWFSDEFTSDLLQEQIDLGRIGPDNIPAYVAEVTYGRMMMFTMTSEATEESMRAHIHFKVDSPAGGASGSIGASEQEKINAATYSAAYIGDSAGHTWLSTLDWTDYFSDEHEVTASRAVPISITIKSTRDDTNAVVQELTEYDRTTCVDKLAGEGTFEFGESQSVNTSFSAATGKDIVVADINGDRNDDVIWAANNSNLRGEIIVALANGDGTFTRVTAEHPDVPATSGNMSFVAGDIDGDGRDDLVINIKGVAGSDPGNFGYVIFYKSVGNGVSEFIYSAEQNFGGVSWGGYETKVAQMDGVRGLDLMWNSVGAVDSPNRSYIAHAVDMSDEDFDLSSEPLFVMTAPLDHHSTSGGWAEYEYWHVGDFNGDGRSDFVWQDIDSNGNRYYAALGTETGLDFGSGLSHYHSWGSSNWFRYISFAGDVDGDGRTDLIEPRATSVWEGGAASDVFGYYVALGRNTASYLTDQHYWSGEVPTEENTDTQNVGDHELAALFPNPDFYIADVDGNGRQDLILSKREGTTNDIAVGLGVDNEQSFFDFSRQLQQHSDVTQGEWGLFDVFIGNIDGDDGNNRDDILWISDGEPSIIYTGRSRRAR